MNTTLVPMKLFDLHCDTASKKKPLFDGDCHINIKKAAVFDRYAQFFAVFIPEKYQGNDAERLFNEIYANLMYQIEQNSTKIKLYGSVSEFESESCYIGAFISIESGKALNSKVGLVSKYYGMGVRMMSLTWNDSNELSGGIDGCGGLTSLGRDVVREMENTGMVLDVSHLSNEGFEDVLKIAKKPFVASHSNTISRCSHKRNLSDSQIKEIISRRGLIGINLYADFLSDRGNACIQDIYLHIEHICELGGVGVLAMGADLDGISSLPDGFTGLNDLIKIPHYLKDRGFTETQIDDIMYNNAAKFFMENNK